MRARTIVGMSTLSNSHLKENQQRFLNTFVQSGCVKTAATACSLNRRTHYDWMAKSSEYAEAFREAKEQAFVHLEAEAIRRATTGHARKVFYKGEPVIDPATGQHYVEYDRSDTLLIFLMKAHKPEVYRDQHKIEVDHKHSGHVALIPSNDRGDTTIEVDAYERIDD